MCVCVFVCVLMGGLLPGVVEKLPTLLSCPLVTQMHTRMHTSCGWRHGVTWAQRTQCLSQLISIGMKWRQLEVVRCFSWSFTKQEAHSSVHPQPLGKPPTRPTLPAHTHTHTPHLQYIKDLYHNSNLFICSALESKNNPNIYFYLFKPVVCRMDNPAVCFLSFDTKVCSGIKLFFNVFIKATRVLTLHICWAAKPSQ